VDENLNTGLEASNSNLEISELKLHAQTNGTNGTYSNGEAEKRVLTNGTESYTNAKQVRSNSLSSKPEWVRLNVGGKEFVSTKTTLCKNAQSFFYKLCQDDPSIGLTTDKDENGAFLIDRDPRYFAPILNYLRHGKLVIESNLQEEGVLEEAEFYNIQDLIHLVKERIKERNEQRRSQVIAMESTRFLCSWISVNCCKTTKAFNKILLCTDICTQKTQRFEFGFSIF